MRLRPAVRARRQACRGGIDVRARRRAPRLHRAPLHSPAASAGADCRARSVSDGLCGAHRPGHFDGVATVVAKLFLHTGADLAFFGEKDFQQLHVVRRMARDLDLGVEIVACPTVREEDGLAMSSRNLRLSAEHRRATPRLASVLFEAAERLSAGAPAEDVLTEAWQAILAAGYTQVEYLELRDEEDIEPMQTLKPDGAADLATI
ncbi:hypothetical protein D3227_38385 [Mesorhizobium waimense]|uniref:pantoate--beta-alanine ligase (AMP-forming) n=1 Tax=Mesorhizobium waimense TaxID=1300307 RepID=A0A3A5JU37_9HYPH|nr:hypothetical protein D3227_38385 [Mesorhizobium waimense]